MPLSQDLITKEISNELMVGLRRTLSDPRLSPYIEAAGHDQSRAIALYLWNVTVGQSFHFPLQSLEVALRNVVASSLGQVAGEKWWDGSEAKYLLDDARLRDISDLQKRLTKRGIRITTDEVVAGLSFGFWVGMVAPKYKQNVWNKHEEDAFPAMPTGEKFQGVYRRANNALDLRNAVFHHEPLIGRDLLACYSGIMELLKWICPETEKWVRANCSVSKVMRSKP